MARLYPFRALRYDTSRVDMSDVVTQPYDKITPAMQDAYYEASPWNLIRVILGKREPGDTDSENVYTRAAAALSAWRKSGILQEETAPALYGYSQTYEVPGSMAGSREPELRERRGFIALGQLYDYADQVVYRHEQTFPKHKSDRLALFKATRAYCEQIYMLYSDPQFTAEAILFGTGAAPELEITDEYGVLHRVWKLTDTKKILEVLAAMHDKKLIIADGHHRYETSVTYMKERAAELEQSGEMHKARHEEGNLPVPAFPEAAMMMTFVNMDAPGITILPTHRVIFGLDGFNAEKLVKEAEAYFTVERLEDEANAEASTAESLLTRLNETNGVAFVAAVRDANYLLTPTPEKIAPLLEGMSSRQKQLDVVQLHKVVLERLLGLDEEAVRAGTNVRYVREATEALAQVADGNTDVAFLIRPVPLDQMADISLNLEVMPQKSTDFYPKLLSGLAMYALD